MTHPVLPSAPFISPILSRREREHEGKILEQCYRRAYRTTGGHFPRLYLPHTLTAEQEFRYPSLRQYCSHGKWPRCEGQSAAVFRRALDRMYENYGALVLLTLRLPELDKYSLYWNHARKALVDGSKRVLTGYLSVKGKNVQVMLNRIERDVCGRTHLHGVTHLSGLCAKTRAALESASHGRDGGVMLEDNLHGVIVGDRSADRSTLAHYLRKHPDGRSALAPDDDLHLDMLEEMVERQNWGDDDPRCNLVWRIPQDWKAGMRLT